MNMFDTYLLTPANRQVFVLTVKKYLFKIAD